MREFQPTGPLAWDPSAILAGFWDDDEGDDEAEVENGVLRISIRGGLSESSWWGTCYSEIRRELARARGIIGLRAVALEIDSPGGEVSGISETVAAIRQTDAVVPVYAYVRGTCASAAYWLAAACRRVVAVETARVGCVGAVIGVVDTRGVGEKLGAKYYRFVSERTPDKAPQPGTDAFDAEAQALVDAAGDTFLSDLGRMRGPRGDLDAVAEHYQGGRMLAANAARDAGWVDAVLTSQPSGADAWLMTGGAPPQVQRAPMSYTFPQVRRTAAATTQEGDMPNENPGGGVVTLTAEAHAELLAQVQSSVERVSAAEARATAAEAKVRETETQRNDAAARLVAVEAEVKSLAAVAREREVSDVIASAVAAGKYAPGDEPKLRAMAAKYGTDGLREMVATVPDGAAGPVRALASGAQIPVDARTMTDAEMAGEAQTRAKANGTTYREEFRKLRAERGTNK